ncbi:hypothetical protein AB0H73_21860 [Streptomyces olivoreticuli]
MTEDKFKKILTEALTAQSADFDKKLADQTQRTDTHFSKLFIYMEKRFDEFKTKADKADIDRLYGLVDQSIKAQEINEHERIALSSQVDRHEDWIQQIAGKLNLKLSHE